MTMNKIIAKLRRKNISHYTLLCFCTILSVVLVTSYAMMFFSPTVQEVLPVGGDSRKQAWLVFGIAIAGCAVFTTYASSLFFRYKTREYGIFMALGEKKKSLKKVLISELGLMIPLCSLIGLVLSIPISWGIWKIFQIFIVDTAEMSYQFGWTGILLGVVFCIFVTLCVFFLGARFIKGSNLIDIIYEQNKTEAVKEVKPWYALVGWIMVIMGVLLGYFAPTILITLFKHAPSPITNVFYLITLVGIYLIILHAVVYTKKGKNPSKYYKHIVSTSMMRFMGRQTVRNMCVIAFLIAGALFAAFYIPTMLTPTLAGYDKSPVDYSFFYKATEDQINEDEIYKLADDYKVNITSYAETGGAQLICNSVIRDFDKDNRLVEGYLEKGCNGTFFSESEFKRISGQSVDVKPGQYKFITIKDAAKGFWEEWDDLDLVTSPATNESIKMKYTGNVIYKPLVKVGITPYVIDDKDFQMLTAGITPNDYNTYVLFNVKNSNDSYDFATALKNEIVLRSSPETGVYVYHDEYAAKLRAEKGEADLSDTSRVKLSPDNTQLALDWKYYPTFYVLDHEDLVKNVAVFLMIFLYISIICFAAVAVIAYTRSVTVGLNNKALFNDLKRLGANDKYILGVVKKQLIKIFLYPTFVGSVAILLLYATILYGNSNSISGGEYLGLGVNLIITLVASLFMYGIYRLSLRKVKKIIHIK